MSVRPSPAALSLAAGQRSLFLRADGCRGWRRLRTAVGVGLRAPSARVSSRPGDGPAGTSRFCPLRSSMTEG